MALMPSIDVSTKSPRGSASAWVPLVLCLVLTVAASAFVGRAEHLEQSQRFAHETESVRTHIQDRMAAYMGVLRGAAAIVSHESPVSAAELRAFVDRLNLRVNYAGTQGIGYSARLGSMSIGDATALAHTQGWDVRIWPDTRRDEVHAIVLLEPLDVRNRAALGYDMRTEPTRRVAIDRARDRGDVALSGKVTLVQEIENKKQAGFLLYAPVYTGGVVPASLAERRAALKGYVYMPLRADDLFAGIFGEHLPEVAYELYDGGAVAPERRLYAYGTPIAADARASIVTLPFAGHTWTARFVATSRGPTAFMSTLQVAGFGLLLSAIVFFVTRARERAREREVRATAAVLASEETARMREMFVGVLGHDLVNPLNAIVLSVEQLTRKLAHDEPALRALTRVRSSTGRMMRLIEQILDLTRARLGGGIAIKPKPMDLDALVRDAVDEIVKSNPECAVEIQTRGELAGEWDADRLAQVVSNLVGNAVRYHGGQPVRVTLDGTAPDRAVIEVHNRGVIAASLLPVLFDPFRGSDARVKGKTPGLGLGLYITHEIIVAHGGSIGVVSNETDGTTFTVVLPRRIAPSAVALPTSGQVAQPPSRRKGSPGCSYSNARVSLLDG